MEFRTSFYRIGDGQPTYIIAEIGSNFEGDSDKAKMLVDLAKKVGANAAKFQTFTAETLVSPVSFQMKVAHQATWSRSVYDTYKSAEFPFEWHAEVANYCRQCGIDFFTSVYNEAGLKLLEEIGVELYKIGSGEINHTRFLRKVASTGKPILLATGASTIEEVERAVAAVRESGNDKLVLMQCVSAYPSPFDDANLRVLETYRRRFGTLVGYSDHTPGSVVPLGAVALGACAIEKHFTWDKTRDGPDHTFAMDVRDMTEMVSLIRTLEKALGDGDKRLYPSEKDTVVAQRRSLHAAHDLPAGRVLADSDLVALRPAVGLRPDDHDRAIGRRTKRGLRKGEAVLWDDLA